MPKNSKEQSALSKNIRNASKQKMNDSMRSMLRQEKLQNIERTGKQKIDKRNSSGEK